MSCKNALGENTPLSDCIGGGSPLPVSAMPTTRPPPTTPVAIRNFRRERLRAPIRAALRAPGSRA